MLRRRPATPRSASAHPKLALAKPRKRSLVKRDRHQARAAVIAATRAAVWARSLGVCEFCGDDEAETHTRVGTAAKATHEMHETFISRAQGRGLPPAVVFNTWNCARACPPCHRELTEHRAFAMPFDWVKGCDGGVILKRRSRAEHAELRPLFDRIEFSRAYVREPLGVGRSDSQ